MLRDIVNSAIFPGTYSTYELTMRQCFMVNDKIPILYIPYIFGAKALIIFAHGNGSDIGMLFQNMYILGAIAKAHVVVFDYPGYGKHVGRSTEKTVDRTLARVYDFIVGPKGMNWPAELIFLQGNCIGCGPITRLATRKPVGGLILQGCLRNVKHAAEQFIGGPKWQRLVVRTLVARRWNVEKDLIKTGHRKVPIFWIHGEKDTLFCPEGTKKMFESYKGPKELTLIPKATHYTFNWKTDVCENVAKFLAAYAKADKIPPVPVLSPPEGKMFREVAKFRNINLQPSPYKEPGCMHYRKLFKQGTIREDQPAELDLTLERQWDKKWASFQENSEGDGYWSKLEVAFGSVDGLYRHLRSRMFSLINALTEQTPKDIKEWSINNISKWIRRQLWKIGNPMGQLDLGFRNNNLEALHYCGFVWRIVSDSGEVSLDSVGLSFMKLPAYSELEWTPIVSTPIVNHEKLTELLIFSLVDKNEHRKQEFRASVSRQWSMAAIRFFGMHGVLLPHPKALIRRKSTLNDSWEPTESLWKLMNQMFCTPTDWERILRRIPTHLVPTEVWETHGIEPPPSEDYSTLLVCPPEQARHLFDVVASKFDSAFAILSQRSKSSATASDTTEFEKACRATAVVAGRCLSVTEGELWYDIAPDFYERLAHSSRPHYRANRKSLSHEAALNTSSIPLSPHQNASSPSIADDTQTPATRSNTGDEKEEDRGIEGATDREATAVGLVNGDGNRASPTSSKRIEGHYNSDSQDTIEAQKPSWERRIDITAVPALGLGEDNRISMSIVPKYDSPPHI